MSVLNDCMVQHVALAWVLKSLASVLTNSAYNAASAIFGF